MFRCFWQILLLSLSLRFADVLQTLGRSVTFLGKRADISLDLSHQQWFISDKEVRKITLSLKNLWFFILFVFPVFPPQMLASFKRQTKKQFLSVLQFSSFLDHMKRCFPDQQQLHRSVRLFIQVVVFFLPNGWPLTFLVLSNHRCAHTFEACVWCLLGRSPQVSLRRKWSGCLAAVEQFGEFRCWTRVSEYVCCSSILFIFPIILNSFLNFWAKKIYIFNCFIANCALQVHAEVEYELLEGAVLALRTLNGLNVKGQPIKVDLLYFLHPLHPFVTLLQAVLKRASSLISGAEAAVWVHVRPGSTSWRPGGRSSEFPCSLRRPESEHVHAAQWT